MNNLEIDEFLNHHFDRHQRSLSRSNGHLAEAVKYSLFSGGKRFRPQLSLLVAKVIGCASEKVIPFAAAVECVHTYSLIHDDLPCMDNDDWRRGMPTNHRVYGEGMAVLAGDALLTEAFQIISEHYAYAPEVGLELVQLLSEAAGMNGMIAGQVEDISLIEMVSSKKDFTTQKILADQILALHRAKTGALIRVSAFGVAVIAREPKARKNNIAVFGEELGLAFQLADDILDYDESKAEKSSLTTVVGLAETKKLLHEASTRAKSALSEFGPEASALRALIEYNLNRQK